MTSRCPVKSLLIIVARAIVGGDVQSARQDAAAHRARNGAAVTSAEGRALIGACAEAHRRYGCQLDWREFAFG
jgi:hypothetical protein